MLFRIRAINANSEGLIEIPVGWMPIRYDSYPEPTSPTGYVYQVVALEPVQVAQSGHATQQMQAIPPGSHVVPTQSMQTPRQSKEYKKPEGMI